MKIKNNSSRRLLWLRPLRAAFLYSPIYALYFRHIRRFMPLPYQDYHNGITARFCPFFVRTVKAFRFSAAALACLSRRVHLWV